MKNELKCADCVYFYGDWWTGHDYGDGNPPYCHWTAKAPDDQAPCEIEETGIDPAKYTVWWIVPCKGCESEDFDTFEKARELHVMWEALGLQSGIKDNEYDVTFVNGEWS